MKKRFVCNIDDVDQHILETITAPMNIELGLLDDGMLKMTVEEILQRQPASNQDCTRFDISFMLMDELSDEEMKQILSAGEQAHWHFDPIKMFVTEHTRLWTLETLFGEVMKEHQLFAKAEQVAAILRRRSAGFENLAGRAGGTPEYRADERLHVVKERPLR